MLHKVEEDLEDAYSDPRVLAHELLHKAAFTGGLSNPLLPDPASLHGLTGDVLREYVASVFTAGNMAVTAAGVPLSSLQQVSTGWSQVNVCGAVDATTILYGGTDAVQTPFTSESLSRIQPMVGQLSQFDADCRRCA